MTVKPAAKFSFNIKLHRKWLLPVALIAGAALVTGLLIYQNGQQDLQTSLQHDLNTAQVRLANIGLDQAYAQKTELLSRIEISEAEFTLLLSQIEAETDSLAGSEKLFGVANEIGVTVVSINAVDTVLTEFVSAPVHAIPLRISLQGNWQDLADYLKILKTIYPNCYIDNAVIEIDEDDPDVMSTLDMVLEIYTYRK